MLRITDAERTREIQITVELAQSIGVIKESPISIDGHELVNKIQLTIAKNPIVLDESPEVFEKFTAWLLHRPDFITEGLPMTFNSYANCKTPLRGCWKCHTNMTF